MSGSEMEQLVNRAEVLYETRLRDVLEADYADQFVAIEPVSGDYFLGATMSDAASVARRAHPDRPTHLMRVGHKAALHFGLNVG